MLQTVLFASLTFGCHNKHVADQVHKAKPWDVKAYQSHSTSCSRRSPSAVTRSTLTLASNNKQPAMAALMQLWYVDEECQIVARKSADTTMVPPDATMVPP